MPEMAPQGLRAMKGRLGEGRCPVPLTGALVRCPEADEKSPHACRIDDLEMGLVVDGAYPAASEVVDLGSGRRRTLDLEGPVVLLGWVAAETVEPLRAALADRESGGSGFSLAAGLLRRRGLDALTLPIALRMGFADICRDLDPHEHMAVRFRTPHRGVGRAQLHADSATLRVVTNRADPQDELRVALEKAFPARSVAPERADEVAGLPCYRVPFPLPQGLEGVRSLVGQLRDGLTALLAWFDPDRHRAVTEVMEAFGPRDSLRLLAPGADLRSGGQAEPPPGPGKGEEEALRPVPPSVNAWVH